MPNPNPTIKDCLDLIREYHVLEGWTDEQIVHQISSSISQNCMAYIKDENNTLTSICLGRWHGNCCLHVIAIAGNKGSLRELLQHLKLRFPHIEKITAYRHGKSVEYALERFKVYG